MRRVAVLVSILLALGRSSVALETVASLSGDIPADARYACPMETHPDETDPSWRSAYFSPQPGKCPWCGMELKPLSDLAWVRIRQAAKGAGVAYTCPDHQHVFSDGSGECPRCGKPLTPFKVMYTCPDSKHAGIVSLSAGNCPQCGRGLAAFRGIWLDESMADANRPKLPGMAEAAAYRCPTHPLVYGDHADSCTICARPLQSTRPEARVETRSIPSNANYTCPMQECWQFAERAGTCSVCGMRLKPIAEVAWAKDRQAEATQPAAAYVCPMHPKEVTSTQPGTCTLCGMQLVHAETFPWPKERPEHVAAQINYIMEHYLELQKLLASDRTAGVARQALGLVSACEELMKHMHDPAVQFPESARRAAENFRAASLAIRGERLEADRVTFVDLSAALGTLIEQARPDRHRWPKLYIYHCPMSKGDWIQDSEEKRNPYYGFKMLTCGELREIR